MTKKEAILLFDSSAKNADLLWASKFWAPDPFVFIKTNGKKILMVSTLEAERARKQARADEVIDYGEYREQKGLEDCGYIDLIDLALKDLGVATIIVPITFSYENGKVLEERGFCLRVKEDPFFEQRAVKTSEEIKYISGTQKNVEDVLKMVFGIIGKSKIKKDVLYYKEEALTSEQLRRFIAVELLKRDCLCELDSIVSSGEQTHIPHLSGSGPLKANAPIIMDVYPRSKETKYWADITRTAVRGEASSEFKELYQTVLNGQQNAISMVRQGIDAAEIDRTIRDFFDSKGYRTGEAHGETQGFIHSTGHGVGLDIHEPPRIYLSNHWILKSGNVFTIEPGLYYHGIGGVRIEDLVVATKDGCVNLTKFPKHLMEL